MVQHVAVGHLESLDVLIAGAGPAGLAMAAEAARFGLRYRIIDKAPHGAEHSQALVLQARTLEQFERYEIAQRAIELGRRLKRIRIYSDRKRILEASFEELPGNYPFVLFLPQTETERLLTEHVEAQAGRIERDVELESFVQGVDSVECELLLKDGSRERVEAAFLIGCDGAHSTVRRLLGMPFEGSGIDFDFFLGDLRLDGDVPGDELSVHLQGGNLVFLGRLDDTHCRVIVALQGHPQTREPSVADFQYGIDVCGVENLRVSDPRWMAAFRVSERRAPAYSSGRVFLAGDATNIHSPVGGQGMNTGNQAAANLMWKIGLVHRGRAHFRLLDSYDRERKPLSDALLQTTSTALRAATASNWFLERLRDSVLSRIAALDAVQNRIRDAVSELGINYRGSDIVRDCGGSSGLRAGDRAPDCEVTDETQTPFRLFALLKDPLHTALAVLPQGGAPLEHFAVLLSRYGDVMQGSVLKGGDELFAEKYAGREGMLYVVRPDGYIAFRSALANTEEFERWCSGFFISPASR